MELKTFYAEASAELEHIYDFWKKLRDDEKGGFFGYMNFDLNVNRNGVKGVILNSRIMWFFSNVYLVTKKEEALEYAKHAYDFMRKFCVDEEYGGVYWMLNADGTIREDMKHTYNQAFAIYGLSSYYDASGDASALELAYSIFDTIEKKCTDEYGYTEAFDRLWKPVSNEKLSEDGYMAEKTMNTLLHIIEAYTELYRVDKNPLVAERLKHALDDAYDKVYNHDNHILGVYFDKKMNSIADVYSYGHDIEASWLIDKALDVLGSNDRKLRKMNSEIVEKVLATAYDNGVIYNQDIEGKVDKTRVWWIQAESVVGFLNAYQRSGNEEYLKTSEAIWEKIRTNLIDGRNGGEWYYSLDENDKPIRRALVEPWKCPYHNGRMCMEVMKRYEHIR